MHTSDATSQLEILGHDSNTLSVDGAKVGILEKANQISLSGLLQGHDGGGLEAARRAEQTACQTGRK